MNKYAPTFVFLLLCLVIVLTNWNCASTLQVPEYEFVDRSGRMHSYKVEIKGLDKTVTHYCQTHWVWETISIKYTKNGKEYLVRKIW
jgi:hypothetical protein